MGFWIRIAHWKDTAKITATSFDRIEFHRVNPKLQLRKVSDLEMSRPKTGPQKI